jgi:hypothetical protein
MGAFKKYRIHTRSLTFSHIVVQHPKINPLYLNVSVSFMKASKDIAGKAFLRSEKIFEY